jgi:hypothetical protein
MKKKLTYEKLVELFVIINSLDANKTDKLSFWINRLKEKVSKIKAKFDDEINIINLDLCSKDKNGDIAYRKDENDKDTLVFTPENLKKKNVKLRELYEQEIDEEIKPCICNDLSRPGSVDGKTYINELPFFVKEILNGYLFKLDLPSDEEFSE